MSIEKVDSRILEPDLICSKDGEVLERSEREAFRSFEQILGFSLSQLLIDFLETRRR